MAGEQGVAGSLYVYKLGSHSASQQWHAKLRPLGGGIKRQGGVMDEASTSTPSSIPTYIHLIPNRHLAYIVDIVVVLLNGKVIGYWVEAT